MHLVPPLCISSRLLPAVRIGDVVISLVRITPDDDGRQRAHIVIDGIGKRPYHDATMRSGCDGFAGPADIFSTFLAFLGACAESYPDGENADLFPPRVARWAAQYADEIGILRLDLDETKG